MSWQDSIPKTALRLIRNEIENIITEVELDESLRSKLKKELLDYIEKSFRRCRGTIKSIAETLAEDADNMEESIKISKLALEEVKYDYEDNFDFFHPEVKDKMDNILERLSYKKALTHGLRALSISLESISSSFKKEE